MLLFAQPPLSVSQKELDALDSSLRVISFSMSSSAPGAEGAEASGHRSWARGKFWSKVMLLK